MLNKDWYPKWGVEEDEISIIVWGRLEKSENDSNGTWSLDVVQHSPVMFPCW